jgi:predicted dehydrogenase
MAAYQRMQIFGTRGRIEIDSLQRTAGSTVPHPPRRSRRPVGRRCQRFPSRPATSAIQGDLFSKAILDETDAPVPLEDAVVNMECIEAVFRSTESGCWERPSP